MSQNARSHRKLKIAGIVALALVVTLLGFAGNFLFDFALNPQAPYTMKMMQDSKNDKEGEQPDAEDTEARAWFKENRESSNLTADDGTELAAWYFAAPETTHNYAVCLHGYTDEPIGMARYVKRFHDRGMNVLAPAARAHERSGGDYIGMGWPERLDIVAWIEQIVQADPRRAFCLWRIDGAATAMNVAGESLPANVKCIIEDCGYTSVWDEFSCSSRTCSACPASLARCSKLGVQRARGLRLS
ncbi:MAG: alpha/beta hydrolase [Collinsella sp.]